LRDEGLSFARDVPVAIVYKGRQLGCCYRLDFLIEDTIIVELKSVREVIEVHKKQVLSYLKLTRRPLALLINFNVPVLQRGISRFINDPTVAPSAIAHLGRPRESFQAPAKHSFEGGNSP
jgi:GxxExxY protein